MRVAVPRRVSVHAPVAAALLPGRRVDRLRLAVAVDREHDVADQDPHGHQPEGGDAGRLEVPAISVDGRLLDDGEDDRREGPPGPQHRPAAVVDVAGTHEEEVQQRRQPRFFHSGVDARRLGSCSTTARGLCVTGTGQRGRSPSATTWMLSMTQLTSLGRSHRTPTRSSRRE